MDIHQTHFKRRRSNAIQYLAVLITVVSMIQCSPEKTPSQALSLINKSIIAHGGWEKWQDLSAIKYKKSIILFDENGRIEKSINQNHAYTLRPNITGRYTSMNQSASPITIDTVTYDGQVAYNTAGVADEQALRNFQSAYYVLNMPWKLRDQAATYEYLGIDTIFTGQVVETIKVSYPDEENSDVWWYYFDLDSHLVMANKVYHPPTYSLITNDTHTDHLGLIWNQKRTSYMVDSLGKKLYVRADYLYEYY